MPWWLQWGQVPVVRTAVWKQVPQIPPSGQRVRSLLAARPQRSQRASPVVRGRPRRRVVELGSGVIDDPGAHGSELVHRDDVQP